MTAYQDIKVIMAERQRTFQFLSQVFFKELSKEAIEQLAAADFAVTTENENLTKGYRLMRRYFTFSGSDRRAELACEYARIFLAAGVYTEARNVAVPYESVFTSKEQLLMQDSRDDVRRWYLREGFMVDASLHEPEDHLALELEFMAELSATALRLLENGERGGISDLIANLASQQAFIAAHLLNWLPRLREVAKQYAELTFYIGMLLIVEGYLQEDLMLLGELERLIVEAPTLVVEAPVLAAETPALAAEAPVGRAVH
jgi:TorA maturation chaperone TorD